MDVNITVDILEFVFLIVPWIAAVGWLSARVLGIHLGRWRSTVVALLGWIGGLLIAGLVLNRDPGVAEGVPMTIFFGVVVAMLVAIVLDLVTRSTRDTPRRSLRREITHPIRTTRNALAPWGRLRELVHDARRHNLVHVRYHSAEALDSPDFAHRVRLTLEEAGGMMVKFGQIASTRTDILPDALTTELAQLRSNVRPVPEPEIRAAIEDALGEPAETAFADFEWSPLAAASIGQTHRATLVTGESVVVKVQRPGVPDLVRRDASVMRLLARQLERRRHAARRASDDASSDLRTLESDLGA
ncbi:MAG: AarF/UbiB family protein, partial [Acidimicrobiia bacterium]